MKRRLGTGLKNDTSDVDGKSYSESTQNDVDQDAKAKGDRNGAMTAEKYEELKRRVPKAGVGSGLLLSLFLAASFVVALDFLLFDFLLFAASSLPLAAMSVTGIALCRRFKLNADGFDAHLRLKKLENFYEKQGGAEVVFGKELASAAARATIESRLIKGLLPKDANYAKQLLYKIANQSKSLAKWAMEDFANRVSFGLRVSEQNRFVPAIHRGCFNSYLNKETEEQMFPYFLFNVLTTTNDTGKLILDMDRVERFANASYDNKEDQEKITAFRNLSKAELLAMKFDFDTLFKREEARVNGSTLHTPAGAQVGEIFQARGIGREPAQIVEDYLFAPTTEKARTYLKLPPLDSKEARGAGPADQPQMEKQEDEKARADQKAKASQEEQNPDSSPRTPEADPVAKKGGLGLG